jgi:DNA polymerase-3 subunit delta
MEAVGPEDMREANVAQFDVRGFTVDKFGGAAMVAPFMAERRVVVVRGLLASFDTQRTARRGRRSAGGEAETLTTNLALLLTALPPSTDAVFLESRVAAGNPLFAAIKEMVPEGATVRDFAPLRRDSLASWVRDRAAQKGAAIESPAVAELVEQVGANLWAMDGELEKLATYCGDRPITAADVGELVAENRELSVFELVDAIMEKRPGAALSAMQRLLEGGATGPYLLSMVARQARMVAIAQELANNKVPQQEWGSRIGTTSDFVVRKTADQARRFTPQAVRGLYRLLLEADLAMKTSDVTEELALTELMAQAGMLEAPPRSVRR